MRTIYKIIFSISIILTVLATVSLFKYGLLFGVDFRGGSVMQLHFAQNRPTTEEVSTVLKTFTQPDIQDAVVSVAGEQDMIVKTGELSEDLHQQILTKLTSSFSKNGVEEKQFTSVGPVVGNELKHKSIQAIIVVLIAISIYIAYVFRKLAGNLSPWVLGLAAIAALIHDVIIPAGFFAWLGHAHGVEIDAVFVAAALTILGFSVSDTVVIFDRVRENTLKLGSKIPFTEVVHLSIKETLVRSINTSLTTLLSLIAVYFFGGESVRYFSLAMILGIFLGAFSSLSIASPILMWAGRQRR
jgi:preprotein translocase subunit SecF